MGVIVDTSVLIAGERQAFRFDQLLQSLGHEPVAMAAITATELLRGVAKGATPAARARRRAFVEALLDLVPVLPYGLHEARLHTDLWTELERKGTVVGPYDMLIAATALAHGFSLATLNRKEFERVPGLELVPTKAFEKPPA